MANKNAGDGKGASKPIGSSETQDATRRLAKQRQRTTGKSDRVTMSDTFGLCTKQGTAGPHRQATHRRPLSQRTQENIERRNRQAAKATEFPALRYVVPGSTEFEIFEGVLLCFATVRPIGELSRTETALKQVIGHGMRAGKMRDDYGRRQGKKLVRDALRWAHRQLETDAKCAVNQQPVRHIHGAPVRVQEAGRQLVAV